MVNVIRKITLIIIARLIIIGEEHRRRAAVGLGDNPEFHRVSVVINGEQAESVPQGRIVGVFVLGARVAPIALRMTRQGIGNVSKRKPADCFGSQDDGAKRKLRWRVGRSDVESEHGGQFVADNRTLRLVGSADKTAAAALPLTLNGGTLLPGRNTVAVALKHLLGNPADDFRRALRAAFDLLHKLGLERFDV